MQSIYGSKLIELRKHHRAELRRLEATIPMIDIARTAKKFWKEHADGELTMTVNTGSIICSLQMGKVMANGRYPSRDYDLQLLRECIDELVDADAKFNVAHDSSSLDFSWLCSGIKLSVWAYHGGNCTYEKVGTKTVEQPVYEMKCN